MPETVSSPPKHRAFVRGDLVSAGGAIGDVVDSTHGRHSMAIRHHPSAGRRLTVTAYHQSELELIAPATHLGEYLNVPGPAPSKHRKFLAGDLVTCEGVSGEYIVTTTGPNRSEVLAGEGQLLVSAPNADLTLVRSALAPRDIA